MSKAEEYNRLCHAMQSGVASEMGLSRNEPTSPKHLRVGVNTAMCETASLARLLCRKGLITEDEYWDALIETMREEVERYEKRLSIETGSKVKLI